MQQEAEDQVHRLRGFADRGNAVHADGQVSLVGDRTECGLLQLASSLGADYHLAREEGQVLRAFPFSSERKRMSTLTTQPGARSAPLRL